MPTRSVSCRRAKSGQKPSAGQNRLLGKRHDMRPNTNWSSASTRPRPPRRCRAETFSANKDGLKIHTDGCRYACQEKRRTTRHGSANRPTRKYVLATELHLLLGRAPARINRQYLATTTSRTSSRSLQRPKGFGHRLGDVFIDVRPWRQRPPRRPRLQRMRRVVVHGVRTLGGQKGQDAPRQRPCTARRTRPGWCQQEA